MTDIIPHPSASRPAEQPRPAVQNIEAEQALLGALLLNNEIADRIGALKPEHFFDPVHAEIFGLVMRLIGEGRRASAVTIKPFFADHAGLAELGGTDYLARMAGAVVDLGSAEAYAAGIREMYARRVIVDTANTLAESATRFTDEPIDDMVSGAETALSKLRTEVSPAKTLHSFRDALVEGIDWANAAFHRDGVPEISTGLKRLDAITNGLQRGRLMMIGGRTSMGKTVLGLNLAVSAAEAGHGVVFASMEMPKGELSQRFVSRALLLRGERLPYSRIGAGDMTDDQFRAVLETARDNERLPIWTIEDDCNDLARLRSAIRLAARRMEKTDHPLGLVVVDYLQLVRVPGKPRVEEVSQVARDLKTFAKEFHVPVVTMAQVKREVEDRKNRRPHLSDIRWSGESEEAADQVAFIYRHAHYLREDAKATDDEARQSVLIAEAEEAQNDVEIIVRKNRGGPTGTANIWGDVATCTMLDRGPDRVSDQGDLI